MVDRVGCWLTIKPAVQWVVWSSLCIHACMKLSPVKLTPQGSYNGCPVIMDIGRQKFHYQSSTTIRLKVCYCTILFKQERRIYAQWLPWSKVKTSCICFTKIVQETETVLIQMFVPKPDIVREKGFTVADVLSSSPLNISVRRALVGYYKMVNGWNLWLECYMYSYWTDVIRLFGPLANLSQWNPCITI